MLAVFTILALILIYFSWRSFRGGISYLNYFADQLSSQPDENLPFSTLIIPCKGIDHSLETNLSSFISQRHINYETIFVVDDESDPAVSVIKKLIGSDHTCQQIKLVIAQKATNSGQKVENLREAVLHADPNSKVFAFADSDARVSFNWLGDLVAPLTDDSVGATTGYRWFITDKGGFAGELRSVWNASIASALGPNKKSNFCWGGSMAIRRETFDRLNIRERWNGTISDDFTVTRIVREAKLDIHFIPAAMAATIEDCSFGELLEFTNRQIKITRVYSRSHWILSFIGSGLFCVVISAALTLIVLCPLNTFGFWAALITLLAVAVFSIGKSWLRLSAIRLAMPDHNIRLRKQLLPHLILWSIAQPVFFINCISALFSNRIVWRGITYIMKSYSSTDVIRERQ